MQLNKTMYIDLVDPLPKSYAPKKGEEMNRSTYRTMHHNAIPEYDIKKKQNQKILANLIL